VAQLEARLAPEAGTPSEGDAAVSSAAMSDASVSDAAKSPRATKDWGVDQMPVDELERCMQLATPRCQRAVAAASKRPTGDGGFQWVKTEPLPAADSTPEGRECLRQARQACEKRRAAAERDVELRKWLDSQLESDQLDRAYSAELEKKLVREMKLRPGGIRVACTPQFCRFQGRNGAFDAGRDFEQVAHYFSDDGGGGGGFFRNDELGPVLYASRGGYRFPGK
jgi:hypothetical protein